MEVGCSGELPDMPLSLGEQGINFYEARTIWGLFVSTTESIQFCLVDLKEIPEIRTSRLTFSVL